VVPISISAEPSAYFWYPGVMVMGRSWSQARPSGLEFSDNGSWLL